jgi:hypothetical protein
MAWIPSLWREHTEAGARLKKNPANLQTMENCCAAKSKLQIYDFPYVTDRSRGFLWTF